MARITIEDCLDSENNRFALVRLASERAKQILNGSKPVADSKGNRAVVTALREIASGKVKFQDIKDTESSDLTEENSVDTQNNSLN